jgi:membrane fusion protein (multidrug efflux system)
VFWTANGRQGAFRKLSGYLIAHAYKEGSFVKKGQLLFQIDPRPFQATLDQAKAQFSQAQGEEIRT